MKNKKEIIHYPEVRLAAGERETIYKEIRKNLLEELIKQGILKKNELKRLDKPSLKKYFHNLTLNQETLNINSPAFREIYNTAVKRVYIKLGAARSRDSRTIKNNFFLLHIHPKAIAQIYQQPPAGGITSYIGAILKFKDEELVSFNQEVDGEIIKQLEGKRKKEELVPLNQEVDDKIIRQLGGKRKAERTIKRSTAKKKALILEELSSDEDSRRNEDTRMRDEEDSIESIADSTKDEDYSIEVRKKPKNKAKIKKNIHHNQIESATKPQYIKKSLNVISLVEDQESLVEEIEPVNLGVYPLSPSVFQEALPDVEAEEESEQSEALATSSKEVAELIADSNGPRDQSEIKLIQSEKKTVLMEIEEETPSYEDFQKAMSVVARFGEGQLFLVEKTHAFKEEVAALKEEMAALKEGMDALEEEARGLRAENTDLTEQISALQKQKIHWQVQRPSLFKQQRENMQLAGERQTLENLQKTLKNKKNQLDHLKFALDKERRDLEAAREKLAEEKQVFTEDKKKRKGTRSYTQGKDMAAREATVAQQEKKFFKVSEELKIKDDRIAELESRLKVQEAELNSWEEIRRCFLLLKGLQDAQPSAAPQNQAPQVDLNKIGENPTFLQALGAVNNLFFPNPPQPLIPQGARNNNGFKPYSPPNKGVS